VRRALVGGEEALVVWWARPRALEDGEAGGRSQPSWRERWGTTALEGPSGGLGNLGAIRANLGCVNL